MLRLTSSCSRHRDCTCTNRTNWKTGVRKEPAVRRERVMRDGEDAGPRAQLTASSCTSITHLALCLPACLCVCSRISDEVEPHGRGSIRTAHSVTAPRNRSALFIKVRGGRAEDSRAHRESETGRTGSPASPAPKLPVSHFLAAAAAAPGSLTHTSLSSATFHHDSPLLHSHTKDSPRKRPVTSSSKSTQANLMT